MILEWSSNVEDQTKQDKVYILLWFYRQIDFPKEDFGAVKIVLLQDWFTFWYTFCIWA